MNYIKELKIGNVSIPNNIFLAPMAGVTDKTFRELCKEQGAGLVYSEMVSAKGLHYNSDKSFKLLEISEAERPAAIQIFGSEPEIISEICERLDNTNADIIDINMGCPAPKITKNGEGSTLMQKPELVRSLIKAAVSSTSKPVTVKIRRGYTKEDENAVLIARIAEEEGASAIAVHGRFREEFYSGKADRRIIAEVKKHVNIPVIGNGDILTPQDAKLMFEETGCNAVMIGRGSQGDPWIFKRIIAYLNKSELLSLPSKNERIYMAIRHLKSATREKGEAAAFGEMRKHIAWYLKGIKNTAQIRDRIFHLKSENEIIDELEKLLSFDIDI